MLQTILLVAVFIAIGAYLGVQADRRREARARARVSEFSSGVGLVVDIQVDSPEQVAALQHEFMDYLVKRGIALDDDLAQIFADWLANHTGDAVVCRQINGDGLVVALPDSEED